MKWLAKYLKKPGAGLAALSPSCREAARLQSEALDRPLTFPQRLGLWIHRVLCRWCRRYGRQIEFLRSAARARDEHDQALPGQSLRPEARARIKRRLEPDKK